MSLPQTPTEQLLTHLNISNHVVFRYYENVDLSAELAPGLKLTYPFIAAAMTSVVGKRMTLECARNGIMAVVPSGLPMKEAAGIVSDVKRQEVKRGDLELLDDPVWIGNQKTVADAVRLYENAGHSVIPICDDFRKLEALFLHQEGMPNDILGYRLSDAIKMARGRRAGMSAVIKPFSMEKSRYGTDFCKEGDKAHRIKTMMEKEGRRVMPILGRDGAMRGLAFVYKHSGYAVGAAIHTYKGMDRADALVEAGADMIVIDSSDGASDYQVRTIRDFKRRHPKTPICAGNIVASKATMMGISSSVREVDVFNELADAGADVIKVGMGTGRICVTTDNRGVGRDILRALDDVYNAREKWNGRYIPIIADGGIGTVDPDMDKRARVKRNMRQDTRSINLTLTDADFVMMGSYFNMFDEAEGGLKVEDGRRYKESWGEGSIRAQTLARYGVNEGVRRAHVEEGTVNLIPCIGGLKPGIERTALNVAITMVNVGARNLREYRECVVLERY